MYKHGSFEADVMAIVKSLNTRHQTSKQAMCNEAAGVWEAEQWRLNVRDFSRGKSHLDGIHQTSKNRVQFIKHLRGKGMAMTESMFG